MTIRQEKIIDIMSQTHLSSFIEFCKLFVVNLGVQGKNFWEYCKVVAKYYLSWRFLKADIALRSMYFFNNPFSISKRFLKNKGAEDIYAYGETPLTTLDYIVQECKVKPSDTVFELGCGRGKTCFWLSEYYGCSVVGVEQIPDFVERANLIAQKLHIQRVAFRNENMLDTNLKSASVIYLYGTCLEDSFIESLAKKFEGLASGTKIITVSYPLSDYVNQSKIEVMKRFPAKFTWGMADVYLHVVK